jgi:N-acetylglucosaminyldiphosphoundecaprenol N-acetyl-beta-D-mannosaminyltransferase
MKSNLPGVDIQGVHVHRVFRADLLQQIRLAAETGEGGDIFNINIHAANLAWEDPGFRKILQEADQVFVDGAGILLAAKLFGWSLGERLTVADWIDDMLVLCAKEGWPVFWLGDTDEVGEAFQAKICSQYPELIFAGRHHGFFAKQGEENDRVVEQINASGAKVLMVGMSMPIQEKWLAANRHRLNVPVRLTFGGAARIATGHIKRGPRWMTDNGLEWLYRLTVQPRYTWRRYIIGNPLFFLRLFVWHFLKVRPKVP